MTDLQDLLLALTKTILSYCDNKKARDLSENRLAQDAQNILMKDPKDIESLIGELIKNAGSRMEFMNAMQELIVMIKHAQATQKPEALQSLKETIQTFYLACLNLQKRSQGDALNLQLTPTTKTHQCKGHLSKGYLKNSLSEMGKAVNTYLIQSTPFYLLPDHPSHEEIKSSVANCIEKLINTSKNALLVATILPKLEQQTAEIENLSTQLSYARMENRKLQVLLKIAQPHPPRPFFGNVSAASLFACGLEPKIDAEGEALAPDITDISL